MSRRKCCRKVGLIPEATCYRPEDRVCSPEDEIVLFLDEFEAIRLADYARLYQEEAAQRMSVSRQTFGRIIDSAHQKIADVLINGKILRIEGGNVTIDDSCGERCRKCKKSPGCPSKFIENNCPRKGSKVIKK